MATPLSREWPLLLATASTRKRTLGKEDSGDAGTGQGIKGLQETLSAAGFEVEVSGEFDSETAHALRQFQRKFRLPATGRVNQQTLDKLQKVQPKDEDPAESTSPGIADLPPVSTNTVHEDKAGGAAGPAGSEGSGGKPQGKPEGQGGRSPQGQQDQQDKVGGHHGRKMRRAARELGVKASDLRQTLENHGIGSPSSPEATGGSSSSSGSQDTQSSSESDRRDGKSSKDKSSESGTPGVETTKVNGVKTNIDPRTGKPIATSATGPIGSTTKGAYGSVDPMGDAFNKAHPRAKAGSATGGQFIKKGDSGPQVKAVQQKINQSPGKTKLRPDGVFGPKTQKAVKGFQGQNNDGQGQPLAVDGVVGFRTAGALKRATHKQ